MQDVLNQIDKQFLQELIKAIERHAQPRTYDWFLLVLSLMSVVFSGIAIFFAVQIPKKIAEKQNNIALFEKRLGVVSALNEVKIICKMLSEIKDISMSTMSTIEIEFKEIGKYTKPYEFIEQQLSTSPYLFSDIVSGKIVLIQVKFLYIKQNIEKIQKERDKLIRQTLWEETEGYIKYILENVDDKIIENEFFKKVYLE